MGKRCWRGRRVRGNEAEAGIDEVEAEKDEIVVDEAVQGQVPVVETGIAFAIPLETTEDDTNIQLSDMCQMAVIQ